MFSPDLGIAGGNANSLLGSFTDPWVSPSGRMIAVGTPFMARSTRIDVRAFSGGEGVDQRLEIEDFEPILYKHSPLETPS